MLNKLKKGAISHVILAALLLFPFSYVAHTRSYCSSQASWQTLGGNSARDGWARDEQRIQPPLQLSWIALRGEPDMADANMIIESSPVIHDSSVYVATLLDLDINSTILIPESQGGPISVLDANSSLISLRLHDGHYQWHTQLGFSGIDSTPTVDPTNNRIYVGARNGNFYAVDLSDGNIAWTLPISLASSPSVSGERIYLGSTGSTQLYILDATNDGAVVDQLSLSGSVRSSPVITNNELFVVISNGDSSILQRYDVTNDTLDQMTQQRTLIGDSWASPLILEDYVIHRSGSWHQGAEFGYVYILSRQDLSQLAEPYQTIGSSRSSPATDGVRLFVSSNNPHRLLAIDIDRLISGIGDPIEWVFEPPDGGALVASPLTANGYVYISTDDNGDPEGVFYALSAATGEVVWQYYASDGSGSAQSSPALAGGKVVFTSYDEQSRIEHGLHAFSLTVPPKRCLFDDTTLAEPRPADQIRRP